MRLLVTTTLIAGASGGGTSTGSGAAHSGVDRNANAVSDKEDERR